MKYLRFLKRCANIDVGGWMDVIMIFSYLRTYKIYGHHVTTEENVLILNTTCISNLVIE